MSEAAKWGPPVYNYEDSECSATLTPIGRRGSRDQNGRVSFYETEWSYTVHPKPSGVGRRCKTRTEWVPWNWTPEVFSVIRAMEVHFGDGWHSMLRERQEGAGE